MKFTIVSLIVLCFSKFVSFSLNFAVTAGWFSDVWCYNTSCVHGHLYVKHVLHFVPVHCGGKMGRTHKAGKSGFHLKVTSEVRGEGRSMCK